jgi:Mycothiol maleylpyruvate isomerase N-terminal domain
VRVGSPTRYGPTMTTTEELLQREDAAWSAFVDAFGAVPDDRRSDEGVVPGWSVHDLVWHCGFWAAYAAEVLHKIARGEPTEDPQDWNALDANVLEDGRAMSWDEVIVRSEENRVRCREALEALPTLTDAAIEEFTGETFEHYEEHAAQVRAFNVG